MNTNETNACHYTSPLNPPSTRHNQRPDGTENVDNQLGWIPNNNNINNDMSESELVLESQNNSDRDTSYDATQYKRVCVGPLLTPSNNHSDNINGKMNNHDGCIYMFIPTSNLNKTHDNKYWMDEANSVIDKTLPGHQKIQNVTHASDAVIESWVYTLRNHYPFTNFNFCVA